MLPVLIVLAPLVFAGLLIWLWIAREIDREPTETDRYLSSVDCELDELAARRATRPMGNVVVVDFSRPRGVA